MIQLPRKLPETGKNAALNGVINQLIDFVRSLTPVPSNEMRVVHGPTGTLYEARPKGMRGKGSGEATWL